MLFEFRVNFGSTAGHNYFQTNHNHFNHVACTPLKIPTSEDFMSINFQALVRVASYTRYSTNLQDESSLDQQKDRCREKALQLGMTISPDLEFSDAASSGT